MPLWTFGITARISACATLIGDYKASYHTNSSCGDTLERNAGFRTMLRVPGRKLTRSEISIQTIATVGKLYEYINRLHEAYE